MSLKQATQVTGKNGTIQFSVNIMYASLYSTLFSIESECKRLRGGRRKRADNQIYNERLYFVASEVSHLPSSLIARTRNYRCQVVTE